MLAQLHVDPRWTVVAVNRRPADEESVLRAGDEVNLLSLITGAW